MIIPVTRNNIEMIETMRPGLQRTLDKYPEFAECWDMDVLLDHLINFQVFGFHQVETGLSGVISVNRTPKIAILNWFWTGKDPASRVLPDYEEVDDFLVHMAQELGCQRVMCDGRRGWEKVGKSFGYHEAGRVYIKSVGG